MGTRWARPARIRMRPSSSSRDPTAFRGVIADDLVNSRGHAPDVDLPPFRRVFVYEQRIAVSFSAGHHPPFPSGATCTRSWGGPTCTRFVPGSRLRTSGRSRSNSTQPLSSSGTCSTPGSANAAIRGCSLVGLVACTAGRCWNTISAPSGRRRFLLAREDQSHDTDPTTRPLEEAVPRAPPGRAAARRVKSPPGRAPPSPALSHAALDEMTSREIELYLKAGGDLVLIPSGP